MKASIRRNSFFRHDVDDRVFARLLSLPALLETLQAFKTHCYCYSPVNELPIFSWTEWKSFGTSLQEKGSY